MGFLNLVWNRNNLQLTPREALRVALERANFKAAKPHAEAILTTEPTLLNNLAIVRMYLGKLEEAETLAETALKVRPGTPEIKATLKEIRTRLKSAK